MALSGCAGITFNPDSGDTSHGYRYYQPAPFLFVHADGKGGLSSEIIYLPDTTQKMSARPYAVLSSNNATLSFSNGMLTESSAVVDETAVPSAFLDAASKAAVSAMAANQPQGQDTTAPPPYLFKIKVHGNTIDLKGYPAFGIDGKTQAEIKVSINMPTGS